MDHQEPQYDLVIIGGGVAGLSAAIYAGRFRMKTALITEKKGGTIILTDDISNYPGFPKISGLDLANKIEEHARDYDIEIITKKVISISRCAQGCLTVSTDDMHIHTQTIIFATGTIWRTLNVPGEKEFTNKGVHYCALCDGPIYTGRKIAVIGGGDSAAKEALLLSEYAKTVHLFVRGEKLRAEPINLERVEKKENITIHKLVNVREIRGEKLVSSLILDSKIDGSEEFKIDAAFITIGHIPLSELAKTIGVQTDSKGHIQIDRNSQTNIPGIYAAGDVTDALFKQAITGVGEAVTAAYSAYHYVNEHEKICYCNDEIAEKEPL